MSSPGVELVGVTGPVSIRPLRSIGGIYPNVTIQENGVDELTITDRPVEQGAAITDHAFLNPCSITLQVGWSNSSPEAAGDSSYAANIYEKMLALQAKREPFDVVTGKRKYASQLVKTITCPTDEKTENALMLTVVCRQIIIVQTQIATVPPKSVQAKPQKTAPVLNTGTRPTLPAKNYNSGAGRGGGGGGGF